MDIVDRANGGNRSNRFLTIVSATILLFSFGFLIQNAFADTVTQESSIPVPTYFLATATDTSGNIYSLGGFSQACSCASASVYKYTPSTNTWTQVASLPVASEALAAASDSSGNIYAIGGSTDLLSAFSSVYKYKPSTNTWTQVASLPVGKFDFAAASDLGGNIYAVGGLSGPTIDSSVYKYVPSAPPPTIIIPPLLKIIAGEWASGQISDSDFLQSVQYFINQGLLIMPIPQANSETTAPIPMWIKTNAFWWANGTISDSDFIKGIQYLFENGYLPVSVNGIPNSVSQALSQSITQLINDVNKMSLPQGTANSLAAKLNSAQSSLSSHQNNAAKAHLNSFISEVGAQSGKKITTDQANELVSAVQNIINSIT